MLHTHAKAIQNPSTSYSYLVGYFGCLPLYISPGNLSMLTRIFWHHATMYPAKKPDIFGDKVEVEEEAYQPDFGSRILLQMPRRLPWLIGILAAWRLRFVLKKATKIQRSEALMEAILVVATLLLEYRQGETVRSPKSLKPSEISMRSQVCSVSTCMSPRWRMAFLLAMVQPISSIHCNHWSWIQLAGS